MISSFDFFLTFQNDGQGAPDTSSVEGVEDVDSVDVEPGKIQLKKYQCFGVKKQLIKLLWLKKILINLSWCKESQIIKYIYFQ